jgi:hypothetical protein
LVSKSTVLVFRILLTRDRYVQESWWHRWSPQGWVKWLGGRPLPSRGFSPSGFLVPEVGPKSLLGKGMAEHEKTLAQLRGENRGGCPFMS